MGHRLKPRDAVSYLAPTEVVERLRDEFSCVDTDPAAGVDHVGGMIAQLLRMKAGYELWKQSPPVAKEIDGQIARLRAVRSEAVNVAITENPADENSSFSFAVIPGEDIVIGYANGRHEEVATPLVMRAAEALKYTVEIL